MTEDGSCKCVGTLQLASNPPSVQPGGQCQVCLAFSGEPGRPVRLSHTHQTPPEDWTGPSVKPECHCSYTSIETGSSVVWPELVWVISDMQGWKLHSIYSLADVIKEKEAAVMSSVGNASEMSQEAPIHTISVSDLLWLQSDAATWLRLWCSACTIAARSCWGRCCWSAAGRSTTRNSGRSRTGTCTGAAPPSGAPTTTSCCPGSASTTIPRRPASHARWRPALRWTKSVLEPVESEPNHIGSYTSQPEAPWSTNTVPGFVLG